MATASILTTSLPAKDRRRAFYNAQERAIIDKHKDAYLAATTPSARRTIAENDIFPQLFDYWRLHNKPTDDKEGRTEVTFRLLVGESDSSSQ